MREETTLAMTAQQHILQWSLAGLSALFAGGLVYLNGYASDPSAVHLTICLLNFGVTIPGIAFCSQLAWWGEVLRMERSGIHLRGMEKYLDKHLSASSPFDDGLPPLRFNTTISFGTYRKIKQGYLGALGIFIGVFVLSNLIYLVLLLEYGDRLQWVPYFKTAAMAYPAVSVLGLLGYGGYLSLLFYKRSLMVADMSAGIPWPEDPR